MKITSFTQNYPSPNFTARKKEIRDADDLVRKARKNFPMYSPTYYEEFHFNNVKDFKIQKNQKEILIAGRLVNKINAGRAVEKIEMIQRNRFFVGKETPFMRQLQRITKDKLGNCEEASIITMTMLAAQGYKNAKRMHLELVGELVDKKTKDVILTSDSQPLDHAFVICPMNNENTNPKESDYIVLDAWMDFADSISGAKARFKRFVSQDDKTIRRIKDDFSLKRIDFYQETGKMLNWSDYDTRYKLVFKEADNYTEEDIKSLGTYARMMYPHLCL